MLWCCACECSMWCTCQCSESIRTPVRVMFECDGAYSLRMSVHEVVESDGGAYSKGRNPILGRYLNLMKKKESWIWWRDGQSEFDARQVIWTCGKGETYDLGKKEGYHASRTYVMLMSHEKQKSSYIYTKFIYALGRENDSMQWTSKGQNSDFRLLSSLTSWGPSLLTRKTVLRGLVGSNEVVDFLLPTRTVSLPIAGFLFLLRVTSWNMPGSLLLAPTAYPSKLVDFLTISAGFSDVELVPRPGNLDNLDWAEVGLHHCREGDPPRSWPLPIGETLDGLSE